VLLMVDRNSFSDDNHYMNTASLPNLISAIPANLMADLQDAADKAAKGTRDPEEAKKACEEMDRIREEIRAKHGVLDIGVSAIRELRDT
jgi:hypothetical protein